MDNYLWFAIAALVFLLVGVMISKNFSGSFNGMFFKKTEGKDNVSISKVKNGSEIDIDTKQGQNINVKDVEKSKLRLNKNDEKS
jgi:hypothetical protein